MKEILLTKDKVAIVDDEDYDNLSCYKLNSAIACFNFFVMGIIFDGYFIVPNRIECIIKERRLNNA